MRRLVLVFLAALAAVPASLRAQEPGPAERRLGEVLALVRAGDAAALRSYAAENLTPEFLSIPAERHAEIWASFGARLGPDPGIEIRSPAPDQASARVVAADGRRMIVRIRTEPEPPYRISRMGIGPDDPSEAVPVGGNAASSAEIADSLGAYVDRLAAADAFSGVVLLADPSGRVALHRAWGEADKAWGIPMRPDTKLNLGSMNKMFTAVVIAQLAEEGLLSYDDPIGKWLGRDWVRPEVGEAVTVRHLLTHTSGLGSYFTDAFMDANRSRFKTVADYAPLVRDDSLAFAPGTDWSYSNTGFLLLGAIVEEITGESYHDVVRERVYARAGMTATDAYDLEFPVENLARGYDPIRAEGGTRYRDNAWEHSIRGGPAGGGYSTAPDLLAFATALRENRLTRPETTALLTSAKPEIGSPDYGYGFQQWEGAAWGHTGGFPGISSILRVDRATGWTAIVMSNYSGGSAAVGRKIDALIGALPAAR